MKVHLTALGCRLNEAELFTWGRELEQRGYAVTNEARDADLVVLNTCAVTGEAAKKSRQRIRRLNRMNPGAHLVVSGCYASLDPTQAASELGVDLVVDNRDKDALVARVFERLEVEAMPVAATEPGASALFRRGRRRAFIKVQDGCRYKCTYCIVTVARGDERSRTIHDVVGEVRALVQAGVKEAVLTGVHVGGYGSDLGTSLKALVESILADTDLERLRFDSVEPWDLPDDFADLFENPRVMPHMHLPIQSGSDTVLKRMARRCKTGEFARLVDGLRDRVEGFNVTTDIIVGFPGETEGEWAETLAFAERMGFGHIHVFPFSPRAGTHAATLVDQVDTETKRARSQALLEVAARSKQNTLEAQRGRRFDVLWESAKSDGEVTGYTPSFHRVRAPASVAGRVSGSVTAFIAEGVDAAGELLEGTVPNVV